MAVLVSIKQHRVTRTAVVLLTVVLLVGCGFQLRGQTVLPDSLATLHIEAADRTTSFMRALVGQLRANGVSVVDEAQAPASVLRIERARSTRQALTISQDARVREYVVHLDVRYSLEDPTGEVLIDSQAIRLSREYQFDDRAILGGRREEEFLTEDLSRAMAAQLVRQLSAQAGQSQ